MKCRFPSLLLIILSLGFEFFSIQVNPALAQTPAPEPTPTLVAPLANPPITNTQHITLSLQAEQAAEFGLFAFYQAQDNANQIAQLASTVDAIAATSTLTDPVVAIDTLPSGNQFAARREFSYGEITASLALIALFLLQLVRFIWDASRPPTY
jgi:hypothetical protein